MEKYVKYIEESVLSSNQTDLQCSLARNGFSSEFPAFSLSGKFSYPEIITNKLESIESHAQLGYFPDLGLCWATIDNTFVIWDPLNSGDISSFSAFTQLIVTVSDITTASSTFSDSRNVYKLVALASSDAITVVGIYRIPYGTRFETKIVNIGLSIVSPCVMTKICGNNGVFYCLGVDGQLYILSVVRKQLQLKLVTRFPFSSVAALATNIKSIWGMAYPPLVDGAVVSEYFYTLDATGILCAYQISKGGLQFMCKCVTKLRIVAIFPTQENAIVAVSETGERVNYKLRQGWSSSRIDSEGAIIPSPLPLGASVTRAWYRRGLFVCSYILEQNSNDCGNVILVSDSAVEQVVLKAPDIPLVECITEQELVSISGSAPIIEKSRYILFLHREHLTTYIKLSPVDVLSAILERENCSSQLLERFIATQDPILVCTLALQIVASIREDFGDSSFAVNTYSPSVTRRAAALLARYTAATVTEQILGNAKEIIVTLSPFVRCFFNLLSSIFEPLKTTPLFVKSAQCISININVCPALISACENVQRILSYIDSTKDDVWFDITSQGRFSADIRKDAVHVSLPKISIFTSEDQSIVQCEVIKAIRECCSRIAQVLQFFLVRERFLPGKVNGFIKGENCREWETKTVLTFLRSPSNIRELASFLVQDALSQSAGENSQQVSRFLEEVQLGYPFLFDVSDKRNYELRHWMDETFSSDKATPARIRELILRLNESVKYMSRRTLNEAVARLVALRCEVEAVLLYMRAAAEQYSSPDSWEIIIEDLLTLLYQIYTADYIKFERIIGNQAQVGPIWTVTPNDAKTHLRILSSLSQERESPTITETMRRLLLWAHTPQLEGFLAANVHDLAFVYIHYLRDRKGDVAEAINVCMRLILDPLLHVQEEERLNYRVRLSSEMISSTGWTTTTERSSFELMNKTLILQLRLQEFIKFVAKTDLSSGDRKLVNTHLHLVSCDVLTLDRIFAIALSYDNYGGLGIAIDVLATSNSFDEATMTRLFERALNNGNFDTLTDVLRNYGTMREFPLVEFIVMGEKYAEKHPEVRFSTPQILLDGNIDQEIAFLAYQEILEKRLVSAAMYNVPASQLVYSMAVLLHASQMGPRQREDAIDKLRKSLNRIAEDPSANMKYITAARTLINDALLLDN